MKKSLTILTLALLIVGCGGEESTGDCQNGALQCEADVLMVCTSEAWVQSQDCSSTGGTCVTGDTGQAQCLESTLWDLTITLNMDGTDTPVDLSELDRTTFEDQDAIRLTRLVEQVAPTTPWNYHYKPIGNDGWDVVVEKMDGDIAGLPYFGELDHGFLVQDPENGGIRIRWDDSVDLPGYLGIKGMEDGRLELIEMDSSKVLIHSTDIRALVDVTVIATQDVVDWKHPEDGAIPMVPLDDIFAAAELADTTGLSFKIWGVDGFANTDDNLMPAENASHTYLEPTARKIISEEAWDTSVCCWRVSDVVVIQGLAD